MAGARSETSANDDFGMKPVNKCRARDRRPFAVPAEPERPRLGGGPRRRALGGSGLVKANPRCVPEVSRPQRKSLCLAACYQSDKPEQS